MTKTIQSKILARGKWERALLMVVFWIVRHLISCLITMIAIFQFVTDLLASNPNSRLLGFSKKLNSYLLQIVDYLTFNSDTKPFPLSDLPNREACNKN